MGHTRVAQFLADLHCVRDAAGHASWWVGGHSWGAELALRYALAYPDQTRGVEYIGGTGIGHAFRPAYRAEMRRRLAGDLPRWEYLRDKHNRTAVEEREFCLLQWRPDYLPGPGALRKAAAMWDDQRRMNLRCNQELAADRSRDATTGAPLDRPVLILHGAEDPRPVWATDSLLAALPKGRRVVMPGAGHSPWVERPATVANVIRGFVAAADSLPG